tara:strand:- start:12056 stop:14710 length:2655 start_codon:yes stop_codon:yes gene_type:complete
MTVQSILYAQDVGFTQHLTLPLGSSVHDIACVSHSRLDDVRAYVRAPAGNVEEWIELPREMWRHVRPKVDGAVMFGYRLHGDWVKSAFAVVASIAISIAVPFIGAALGGGILGAIGGGLAGAALGIGASLAINALFPSQQARQSAGYSAGGGGGSIPQERARQFSNVESGSNVLAKEAYLPVVVGTRRISPPEIAQPHYYLEDGQQAINRIFAFDGHHAITDIQVDRAPVSDYANITTQVRDGAETTSVSTFVTKVTAPVSIGSTLSTFSLDALVLVDQEEPANSVPTWTRFTTVSDSKLEEIAIRLQFDSFIKTDSATDGVRVPVRIRLRPKGSNGAWINLPEIHFLGRDVSTSLKEIRFRWDSAFGEDGYGGAIQAEFYQRVPAASYTLSDGSTGDQWQADSHFVAGSGLRDTKNVQGRRNSVRFTLNETTFPKVEYEWEIIRGLAVLQTALDPFLYLLSSAVNSFFVARDESAAWNVPIDQGAFVGRITVQQVTSIVNRQPCQRPNVALIALKAKGQSVRNVTALASRYVMDWDGDGWNTLTTTSNPATHYRQVLHDYLTYHGISADLIVNDQFVAWRQECIDRGYEVSAIFSGSSVKDTLDGIATAGYARPRFSDGFGIDWFRDRSAERPVQTFSPRNASINLQWVMGEKPVGIRANFQNADRDYADDEIQINNPFYSNFVGYDVKSYATIAKPALVRRRATFDMLQAYYQGRRAIIVDCSIEGLICDRGDLVGVVTDLMDDAHSGARVRKVIDSTTFIYDQDIPTESTTSLFGIPDIFDPANIFTVGEQSVVLMSTPNGTEMRTIVAAEITGDGAVIRVSEPFSSVDYVGAHFVLGPVSRFMTRCIVSEVKRQGEERAQLVLVDEAPEIFQGMQERFGL